MLPTGSFTMCAAASNGFAAASPAAFRNTPVLLTRSNSRIAYNSRTRSSSISIPMHPNVPYSHSSVYHPA